MPLPPLFFFLFSCNFIDLKYLAVLSSVIIKFRRIYLFLRVDFVKFGAESNRRIIAVRLQN